MRSLRPTRTRVACFAVALWSCLALSHPVAAGASAWPREFDASNGTFVVYAPQPERLIGDVLEARAAFSLQGRSDASPRFGVLIFRAHVDVDRDSSTVVLRDLDVTRVRLPGADSVTARRTEHLVEDEALRWDLSGSLEALQSGLAANAREHMTVDGLEHAPPRIVFADHRTILVQYDGTPDLEPIPGSRCQRVGNTPYAVVYDPRSRTYYLNGANVWYEAQDPLGPWTPVEEPPMAVVSVVPPDTVLTDRLDGEPPAVITATVPTELIVTDGEPQLEPLVGDRLFYVVNTQCDVLRDASTRAIWVLLSGRWFTADSLAGPWRYVSGDSLPDVFSRIPADSPRGNLLASVAGTEEADDALADVEIPQTSAVTREDHDIEIAWDGDPQFVSTPGSTLQYGVNTDAEVVFEDGRYFLCDQGVWYLADRPDGPWIVSGTRPHGIDGLGPACPVYNLRYVEIYGVSSDIVYVGYLPGYLGYYPYHGTVVYGTGYHYKPWRERSHYYARPWTWGCLARYNPWLSRWSFGFSWSTGFLRVGLGWRDVLDGRHHRRPPLWLGPGGFHRQLLDPEGAMVRIRTAPPTPRAVAVVPSNLYTRAENRVRSAKPVGRAARAPVRLAPLPDDVFAGSDGNVYQRGDDGRWRVHRGRNWEPAPAPVTPPSPVSVGGFDGGVRFRVGAQQPGTKPEPEPVSPVVTGDGSALRGHARTPAPQPVSTPTTPAAPAFRPIAPAPMPVVRPTPPEHPMPWTPPATPGTLEREFQARQHAAQPPAAPAAPARRAPEEKPKDERRTK